MWAFFVTLHNGYPRTMFLHPESAKECIVASNRYSRAHGRYWQSLQSSAIPALHRPKTIRCSSETEAKDKCDFPTVGWLARKRKCTRRKSLKNILRKMSKYKQWWAADNHSVIEREMFAFIPTVGLGLF